MQNFFFFSLVKYANLWRLITVAIAPAYQAPSLTLRGEFCTASLFWSILRFWTFNALSRKRFLALCEEKQKQSLVVIFVIKTTLGLLLKANTSLFFWKTSTSVLYGFACQKLDSNTTFFVKQNHVFSVVGYFCPSYIFASNEMKQRLHWSPSFSVSFRGHWARSEQGPKQLIPIYRCLTVFQNCWGLAVSGCFTKLIMRLMGDGTQQKNWLVFSIIIIDSIYSIWENWQVKKMLLNAFGLRMQIFHHLILFTLYKIPKKQFSWKIFTCRSPHSRPPILLSYFFLSPRPLI